MNSLGLIMKNKLIRRYSYDDFFLVDNQHQRVYQHGRNVNEFIGNGVHYLVGEQYELLRKLTRQKALNDAN